MQSIFDTGCKMDDKINIDLAYEQSKSKIRTKIRTKQK